MIKKVLLIFLFYLINLNQIDALNKVSHCNCRSPVNNRIIGGRETDISHYPHQISLGIKPDTPWEIKPDKFKTMKRKDLPEFFKIATHICGGALIGDRWVLTAAHCCTDSDTLQARDPKNLGIGYGNKVNLVDIYNHGRVKIDKIYVHPLYNVSTKDTTHDIALIRLAEPIDFDTDNSIRPACMLQENLNGKMKNYGHVTGTGWGSTQVMNFNYITRRWTGYKASLQLKEATFKDVSHTSKICSENQNLICISSITPGESVCKGDSGGPLHYQMEGNTFVVGVTSFGSTKRLGTFEIQACSGEAGYTRVQSSLNWIKSIIDVNEICLYEEMENDKIRLV